MKEKKRIINKEKKMLMSKRSIYACIGSGHSRFHHALAREYCTKRKTISIMSEGSKYCAIVKSVKGLTELGKESSSASKSEKWVPTTYCIIYILKGKSLLKLCSLCNTAALKARKKKS